MTKKNLWPIGITTFLVLFVVVVVAAGILISRINYDLVHPDYYAKEIAYEDHLESLRRADALTVKPVVRVDGRSLVVQFPEGFLPTATAVQAHLYYAADKQQDMHVDIDGADSGMVTIPLAQRPGGNWRVTLEWLQEGEVHRITGQERFEHL